MREAAQETAGQALNLTRILLRCIFLACALLLAGCLGKEPAPQGPGAGAYSVSPADFNGQWWEFYERGRSLAESGQHREAAADFLAAIAQRDQDQWQAPIDDAGRAVNYFPHRELGILYVASKEFDKAIIALEASIASAPSAKASFFLNKARSGKFARDAIDRSPPELFFEGSTTPQITSKSSKVVTGVASDDTLLAALTVAGRPVPMSLAEQHKVFKTEVTLAEGRNSIKAVATDLAGKTTEKTLEIFRDRNGPLIEIDQLVAEGDQVTVSGIVSDDHQLGSLVINGRPWPMTGKAPGYNFKFTLPEGRITIVATDRAGNVTGARVRREESDLAETESPPLPTAKEEENLDSESPRISVEGLGPEQETSAESVQLAGQISDSSLLVYISINGEQILNRKGRSIFFSQMRSLREGINTFRINAADEYGNKARRTVTVTRKVKAIWQNDSRLRLALLPFSGNFGTAGQEDDFTDRLRKALTDLGRFNLVTQDHIAAASRAFQLSPGASISPLEAAGLGQAVGAHAVLSGRVLAGPDAVEIVGQFTDTETATLLARNDTYGETTGGTVPDGLLTELAAGFADDFPLAEGTLLEVRGQEVRIDLGSRQRIRPLTRLLCYREGPPARHPVTGEPLEAELEIIGELLVTRVDKESSWAKGVTLQGQFLRGDKVITR
jgi:tetratricopeptide (TPR) repeat protein